MGRPVILGNGALTVGLDEHGLVHDFYYPYVGLDNLTTARSVHHKIGVWVDGVFSWIDDGNWQISVDFEATALIGHTSMQNDVLGIRLEFTDFVDSEINLFGRSINVINISDAHHEVRLFMHQVFQISRAGRADTAFFVPDDNYILDYRGRCNLLIYGQHAGNIRPFDQFAIGSYGIEGKEGTFRDAEDGELSGSAVEHGGVDSVMGFNFAMEPQAKEIVDYWVIAADTQQAATTIHQQIRQQTLRHRLQITKSHWQTWIGLSAQSREHIPQEYQDTITKSLLVIASHTDKRGGVIASCDSSIYNYGRDYYSYVWPRDGAYAMWPLIRLGYRDEPRKFFEFCRDVVTDGGYLMHKYQPDKAIGSTWHPMLHKDHKELAIQEDETAIVVFMLGEYLEYSGDTEFVRSLYDTFVRPAANFMTSFIDEPTGLPHASYDLWEEKFLTNTYSVAVTYQALLTAADFAEKFEYADDAARWQALANNIKRAADVLFDPERQAYRKGYLLDSGGSLQFDNTLDVSSLYGVMMFDLCTGRDKLHQTATAVENTLLDSTPSGGAPRFEHDGYFLDRHEYLGNPWFVTTLWMAQYYIRIGKPELAIKYIKWTTDHALCSGILSEQVNPVTGAIISVTPLVWSHAELINTILDLSNTAHFAPKFPLRCST